MFKAYAEISLFGSYLKTAIRNLARHRIYSVINIIGIAIALAFCILTFLFVHNEWTYDTFHENADRIYLVSTGNYGMTPSPLGPALRDAFPAMQTSRVLHYPLPIGKIGTEGRSFEANIGFADPNFFDIFSFSILQGDPSHALQDKYSALITEKTAQKYFNNANPVGELLPIQYFDKEIQNYTITGIVKNVPNNSTIQFDVLLSSEHFPSVQPKKYEWRVSNIWTYMMLPPNVSPKSLEQQFPKYVKLWWGEKSKNQLNLQPLTQRPFVQKVYSYILSGITMLVLFIACVNFITLTLGRQATRAREVGLRKVVGAKRMQIANQFIGESLLLITIALIVGIALAELALPTFNNLIGKSLTLSDGLNFTTLAFLILLVSLVGITAGGYPAFILSRFQPTQIITNRFTIKTGNRFGKILIVFQFALSIFLLITTLMMSNQLTYLRTQPLGYQTEHVIAISTYDLDEENETLPNVFRDLLLSHPSVISTTWLSHPLNNRGRYTASVTYEGSPKQSVENIQMDYDLFKTLDIKLVAGRAFSKEFPTDKEEAVIVNESLVKTLGIEDPIGKTIKYGRDKTIIGVVQDFHYRSLHHKIAPAILYIFPMHNRLLVRIHPENVPGTIAFIKEQWEKVAPNQTFDFSFLDEGVNNQYQREEYWNLMIQYATGLAVFIAALGAFGLAALATARRTKEIGIRKVLGASQSQILSLLSREFVLYIALSSLIAFPIAYYATNQWLQIFAYRTELGADAFLLGSIVMFLVVLTTVTAQTLKAARANPADALRDE